MVLLFTIIMTITGLGYMYFSMLDRVIVRRENMRAQSFYLADAGIESAKSFLMMKKIDDGFPEETYGLASFSPPPPFGALTMYSEPPSSPGRFRVSIDPDDNNPAQPEDFYYITSTGTIGNIEKSVRATVRYQVAVSTRIQVVSWEELPARTIP